MRQAIYKMLSTRRYDRTIYSPNYGVALDDLLGARPEYALPEIKRRVTEALSWDSRVEDVYNFAFTVDRSAVHCSFTVRTIYGDVDFERSVVI